MIFPGIGGALDALYYILWVFPIYVISFILNSFWYGDIATGAYAHRGLTFAKTKMSLTRRIAMEVHRTLLVSIYLIQCSLIA